jgi:hypothetical protein
MADVLAPIAEKLKPLIRLLASDHDGEAMATVRAIGRLLKSARLDFHTLADRIGQPNGLSEAEMRKLYDAGHKDGYAAGRRAAEKEYSGRMFHSVNFDEEPSWHEIACECAARPDRLRDERERKFVHDMTRRLVHGGEPTEKQRKWLRDIYARVT